MKKFVLALLILIIAFNSSCFKDCTDTDRCPGHYWGNIKIDGNKNDKISIKYIGPKRKNYEQEFGLNSESQIPFYKEFFVNSFRNTKDFEKNNYNFLEIKNLSTEEAKIWLSLGGKEIDEFSNHAIFRALFRIFHEQDIDPNFDYTKDSRFKDFKNYIPREELYKKLENEKYPYFVKLPPQKTCIVKWGNKSIQIL